MRQIELLYFFKIFSPQRERHKSPQTKVIESQNIKKTKVKISKSEWETKPSVKTHYLDNLDRNPLSNTKNKLTGTREIKG